MERRPRYWFAAKRYGWGWGLPLTWEGWLVSAVWSIAFFGGLPAPGLRRLPTLHLIFVVVMVGSLVAVCYWKGKPPRWRWGD